MTENRKLRVESIITALDEEIRGRGHGSIRDLERHLGKSKSWWQGRVRKKDLTLRQLALILHYLGLDPIRWIRRGREARTELEISIDRPRGQAPVLVQRALARFERGSDGLGIGEVYLDTLDERRHDRPDEVRAAVEIAVDAVELRFLPRLLAISGSSYRLLRRFDEAEHCFCAAIEIGRRQGDRVSVGNLARRLSYVVADRGDRDGALELATEATSYLLREGDLVGVAKGLVEQGMWLYYLGRTGEAASCLRSALDQLPEEHVRYRASALQSLGVISRDRGDVEEALEYLHETRALTPQLGARHAAKASWLESEIYAAMGRLDEAEELLWSIVDVLTRCHFGEAALATCDLVRVQLLRGEPQLAYQTATSMRALLEPLRKDEILSGAIAELLRAGSEGLTLALVEKVKTRIEDERRTSARWALLVSSAGGSSASAG